ncbi:MAG: DUF1641 domain-containing protein [Kofleriaceae bacterium]
MSVTAPTPVSRAPTPAPDPILAALERIERRLAAVEEVTTALAPLVALTPTLPGAIAAAVDTFDDAAARMGARGIDLDERMRSIGRAVEVATAPRAVHGLASLVESRLLEPSALAVVSQLAAALAEPGTYQPVGTWGMLKALRDPDVQRALGFAMAIARTFGKHLATGDVDACRERLEAPTTKLLEAP